MKEDFVLERIESLCKQRGYTLYKLAKISGVHPSSLSTLMNRKSTPNVFTLDKICRGFGITLSEFFTDDDNRVCLSEEEEKLLNMWDCLDDTQKQIVNAYMQGLKDSKNYENE